MAKRESLERERDYQHYGWFKLRILRRPETITTTNAILWGVAWLIIMAILGWYFDILPSSAFSFVATTHVRLAWSLAICLTVCITWTLLFLVLALIRNRKIKSNELIGRMLFAHWPVILVMLPGIVSDRVAFATYMGNPLTAFELYSTFSIVVTAIVVVVLVWSLYWSYQAYVVTTQRNQPIDKVLFVAVAILSELVSYVVAGYVLEGAIS
ncbi:MAG: hypothetical protein IIX19_00920 [Alistipes sp.]|nr:hypothetical protein [Alistipes sp.]